CCREIAMTEQHLYDTQIRAMVQQMRGKSVPQGMRRKFLRNAGLTCVALDNVPESLTRHPIASPRREQIVCLPLEEDLAARALRKVLQPAHRFLAERDEPLAIAFAEYADYTLIRVHLAVA